MVEVAVVMRLGVNADPRARAPPHHTLLLSEFAPSSPTTPDISDLS
jgi:hypothetical protein